MNVLLRSAVLSLSVLGLGACTTMHEDGEAAFVKPQRAPSVAPSGIYDDAAYIAQVERIARHRGVEVVWVHPPRQPLVASNSDE